MYTVVHSAMLEEFTKLVNDKIRQGFVPVGGVCVEFCGSAIHHYYQALMSLPAEEKQPQPERKK